ncbi:hypothetical protein N9J72_01390 [Candidatus Gracilibacteria bacterium]|nr:hypothetical protein [Candidatus Gracilibacteria bacterium]
MKYFENMNLADLKHTLSHLKTYEGMVKKLGNRGRSLFHKTLTGKKSFVVEYFPSLGVDEVYTQSLSVFQKSFSASPKQSDIVFVPRDDIKGGMKVYCDDNMVDMSYKKIETLMQK